MIDGPGVAELCAWQYETAIDLDLTYVHATYVDDYRFGSMARSGLGVLRLLREGDGHTVLDIGSGYGRFLRAAKDERGDTLQAIGFNAVANNSTKRITDIDWVFGDFQRTETWKPKDVIKPGTVDLAVASKTILHFVDPLRTIQNAYRALKEGGSLLIDETELNINPNTGSVANQILKIFEDRSGDWTTFMGVEGSTLYAGTLHLVKQDEYELPLDDIVATVDHELTSTVVTYKAA